ncbi:glycosyltransferase [Paucihalobacter ruber]|uniref:Glycosyltransferase n=1 Tax=Paucihalobacter ruber TaxID=2567861 RepID=A0A506PHR7_9FLAO|nr:glycosyltransferase [Paucihalobacter ruber]TPV33373.1 glycosyltransferase [Paucihalobacter ruber]
MNFLISIIVPVYNVDNFIERCILSLIHQTYQHLEIILINDGSTDNSGSLCDKYAKIDQRIQVFHISNGGSSIARNYGLKVCKGDYIGFVDSDDWIDPKMFELLLKYGVNQSLKVIECSSIDSNNYTDNHLNHNLKKAIIEDKNTFLERVISHKRFAVWRRLYHRSVLTNRFFIEHILHQDVYYTIDVLTSVNEIGFIDSPLYIYNVENRNSVIRSEYSLKKLNSINAAYYVLEQTKPYHVRIQNAAKKYLFNFLNSHYNSLFDHHELDPEFYHRKKIKKSLGKNLSFKNFDFYSFMIVILPFTFYQTFLRINRRRISFKQKLFYKY